MNRMLGLLPSGEAGAIPVSATVPLALRRAREVASYAPSVLYQGDAGLRALRRRCPPAS